MNKKPPDPVCTGGGYYSGSPWFYIMSCVTADFYVVSASVHGWLLLSGTVAVCGVGDVC